MSSLIKNAAMLVEEHINIKYIKLVGEAEVKKSILKKLQKKNRWGIIIHTTGTQKQSTYIKYHIICTLIILRNR